ncbi:MAG: S8 family serine peptidase [Flavobacteriales bacterium]|nr:S8 family serine peptidase [Flavobacteriales bacterium]
MIQRHSAVEAAQFNHIVEERLLPNDPSIGTQWHHVDASDNDIDSDLAWDITTGGTTANGDEIVVCVLEGSGSNYNHTDLIANHWTNPNEIANNGIDDDGNGYIDDVDGWNTTAGNDNIGTGGHGTAVSGMIGAKGNNSNGGAGVNWDVKIMQVDMGSLTEAGVIAAYEYPYTMRDLYNTTNGANGAFVVATNASWGIDNANPASYPLWCAYYDDLGAVGILNCGATANNNVNIDVVGDMPTGCSSDYMISVTATNSSDVRTFSGYGATTIDLGAPGESVYLPSGTSAYSSTSGTSFASPCVAGAIALVYSAPCSDLASLAISNPQQAANQVRSYILNGVDPVANLVGECVTGGRLNVRNAIDLALNDCGPLPPCNPVSHTLSADCFYNSGTGTVEATITIDVTMSENFCSVETVCYSSAGTPLTCDDLVALGYDLDNNNTYTIYGLNSNESYDVYYTTADGTSGVVSIITPDCTSEIPGCTDPIADNYDSNATFDDGSCTYPCETVTLSILTDCWGGEVSWELLDAGGAVVAAVAANTYGNQQTFTWSQCLDYGCYTFNIYDSFGDGLDGTASGCAIDGDYSMTGGDGSVIFQMATPNYGSGTSHSFCLSGSGTPGCMDTSACNYDSAATTDDGSCTYPGCTDLVACNYNATAGCDDGSCTYPGCNNVAACNYDVNAGCNDGSCTFPGCIDNTACNYNAAAGCDDGSCTYPGCIDNAACNYNATAGCDDGSCTYPGCIDSAACNYDSTAGCDDGSCTYPGCTDNAACNYNSTAGCDDGSCTYPGCIDSTACNYDSTAGCDDGNCEYTSCTTCEGDFDNSGVVDVADLLLFLGDFGCNSGPCLGDLDENGATTTADMLIFLGLFGNICP